MLALTFEAAGQRFALATRHVVEVLPWLQVQPVARVPAWVAGFFSYRGEVTPLLDLGRLVGGAPCACRYNSRVLVVNLPVPGETRRVGLLAERVGTAQLPDQGGLPAALAEGAADAWGTLLLDDRGVYQLLDVARLLPAAEREALTALPPGGTT
jgi:chemotaxis-related protein WspB